MLLFLVYLSSLAAMLSRLLRIPTPSQLRLPWRRLFLLTLPLRTLPLRPLPLRLLLPLTALLTHLPKLREASLFSDTLNTTKSLKLFPSLRVEQLFLCHFFNAQCTMHNAQCTMHNGLRLMAKPIVVAYCLKLIAYRLTITSVMPGRGCYARCP